MAIVIRDGDIINIQDQNILTNNKINKVDVQEKMIEIGDKNINTDRSSDGIHSENVLNSPFYKGFHKNNITRIEISQASGSFNVDKTSFPFLTQNNIEWTLKGSFVEEYEISNSSGLLPTVSQMIDDNSKCSIGYYNGMEYKSKGEFTQQGNWGVNGIVTLSNRGTTLKYDDNRYSHVTVIEKDDHYEINFNITVQYIEMAAESIVRVGNVFKVYNLKESQYVADTLRFDLFTNDVTVKNEPNTSQYGEQNSIFSISLDVNPLYQKKTTIGETPISQFNANKIISDWSEGKESVTIEVGIGEYYDEAGNLVISSKDNDKPMLFSIGDVVVPLVKSAEEYEEDGVTYMVISEKGISEYSDGLAKRFFIYDIQNNDDGLATQILKLAESDLVKKLNITIDDSGMPEQNITFIKLTRISSPTANAPLGEIDLTTAVIYLDDEIKIEVGRKEGYERGYNSEVTLNGSAITNGSTHKVESSWDVYGYSNVIPPNKLTYEPSDVIVRLDNTRLYNNDDIYLGETLHVSYNGISTGGTIINGEETITLTAYEGKLISKSFIVKGDVNIKVNASEFVKVLDNVYVQLETSYSGVANNDMDIQGLLKNEDGVRVQGSIRYKDGSWKDFAFDRNEAIGARNTVIGFGLNVGESVDEYIDPTFASDDYTAYLQLSIPQAGVLRMANHGTEDIFINSITLSLWQYNQV